MELQKRRGKLCLLVCAWLWVTGLILMGKIEGSLGQFIHGKNDIIPNMDALAALQIFFVFYTVICVALYFVWRRLVEISGRTKNLDASIPDEGDSG